MKKQIVLVGGDQRTPYLAKYLSEKMYDVTVYGMEQYKNMPMDITLSHHLTSADIYVLPIPCTKNNVTVNAPYSSAEIRIESVLKECKSNGVLFGGNIPDWVINHCQKANIIVFDYGKKETFAKENALPTAEGTIEILMNQTPCVLEGQSVCVVGYGRIGKVLAQKLKALGCKVTVTARKTQQLEEINKEGYAPFHTNQLPFSPQFDIIINTVPAPVITKAVLLRQNKDCFLVDLASKPGGVDFEYAKTLGMKTIHALSLPAKHAPATAADIIAKSIFQYLHETE